jgi:hypothetical protein
MALCIPVVVGPVNELMTEVRVQGAVPGATLVVTASGPAPREVARGQAGGGDDWVLLLAGETLKAGDLLLAAQDFAGDVSPAPPPQLGATVAPAPAAADLGFLGTRTHLYRCGSAIWLTGAYPGATVNVSWDGVTHGSAMAGPDGARVGLDDGMPTSTVHLAQSTPAGSGPETLLRPDPLPVDTARPLPPPTLHTPLLGCQKSVLVTGVIDGATVTLTRATGTVESAVFDQSGLWFGVHALREQDRITVRQDLRRCEINGEESGPVKVGPPSAIPAPIVPDSLCRGAVSIRVGNLVSGALVHLTAGTVKYTGMAPGSGEWATFFVAPLTTGTVTAHQELVDCAVVSPESAPATKIDTQSAAIGAVTIRGPLLSCGRVVPISNAHVGALLQVAAKTANDDTFISGVVVADAPDMAIAVTPYLREGDRVRVLQWACASALAESAAETVKPHAAPAPPQVAQPTFSGSAQVLVVGVLSGALVDVYSRRGEHPFLIGSGVADSPKPTINISTRLQVKEQVFAVQTICGVQTEPGPVTTVVIPPPAPPLIKVPAQGATNVGIRPTFTWVDPGKGTDEAATSYELTVLDGATAVIGTTAVPGTSFPSPHDLNYKRKLTLHVRAFNASGASAISQVVFTTQDVPPPVAPKLASYDTNTQRLTGSGFLPNHSVRVRLAMLGSSVSNMLGQAVPDTRDASVNVSSDGTGNLSAVVQPANVLPILPLQDDNGGYASGVISGEVMHVSATDGRTNAADLTGLLWSNTLSVSIP